MRRYLAILAAAAIGLTATAVRADEILNIGDPAPKLDVSGWVKGEKVEKFEPGKTYVVEFWATWCGPCRMTIPHLTELAHKYKDKGVRFIGVDAFEHDVSKVRPFVSEMGDKMDYSVALDSVRDPSAPSDGAMAKNWMEAAEENGIPTAFIVHDGKIAWIGHPMRMDQPLEEVVAGKWDPTPLIRTRLVEKTKERRISVAQKKVTKPFLAGDYRAALSAIEEVASADPELAREEFASIRLNCLTKLGEVDEAVKVGEKLLAQYQDDAIRLDRLFSPLIDLGLKQAPDPRIAQLALQAARRAEGLTKESNFSVLDMLAVALYRTGDSAGAVAAEERALKALDAQVSDKSQPGYQRFRKTLEAKIETFRKAEAKKGPRAEKP